MAPELYEEQYTEKVDVYSFGTPPRFTRRSRKELREFIELCIGHDEAARPEARQLLKHRFFKAIRSGKMCCPGVDRGIIERNAEDGSRSPSDGCSSGGEEHKEEEAPTTSAPLTDSTVDSERASRTASPAPVPAAALPPSSASAPRISLDMAENSNAYSDAGLSSASQPEDYSQSAPAAAMAALNMVENSVGSANIDLSFQQGLSPQEEQESSAKPCVKCLQMVEESKLTFQMRFMEQGNPQTIEFVFDLGADTADAIANEMMEDLSLSATEAQAIAAQIRQEVDRMTGQPAPVLAHSASMENARSAVAPPPPVQDPIRVSMDSPLDQNGSFQPISSTQTPAVTPAMAETLPTEPLPTEALPTGPPSPDIQLRAESSLPKDWKLEAEDPAAVAPSSIHQITR
eukprot:gene20034-26752_t